MTETQHGVLQWMAAGGILAVGILFGRLIEQGRSIERQLHRLVDDAEVLAEEAKGSAAEEQPAEAKTWLNSRGGSA